MPRGEAGRGTLAAGVLFCGPTSGWTGIHMGLPGRLADGISGSERGTRRVEAAHG